MRKGAFILAALFAIEGCLQEKNTNKITIDGSSTVYLITEGIVEEFSKKHPEVKISVGISGTGGGFKKFCRGEIDITNASREISEREIQLAKENNIEYEHFLIAYDALTVVVNPSNNWVNGLSKEELRAMWCPDAEGKIKNWKEIRDTFPDKPLELYGPGTASGTFDYFTEVICGKAGASRGDYTPSEDDNVLVVGISNNPNALGYFGLAYYMENKDKIKSVPIWNDKEQKYIEPSEENARGGIYPLTRPLFIYVNKKLLNTNIGKEFVKFYIENCIKIARDVGYVPITEETQKEMLKKLELPETTS